MNDKQIIPADQILPVKLSIVTLIGKPLFPGIFQPLIVGGDADIRAVDEALGTHGYIGLVLLKDAELDHTPLESDMFRVGTVAKIIKKINLPDGGISIFLSTLKRFQIKKLLTAEEPFIAAVEYLEETIRETNEIKALTRALIGEMKQVSENNPMFSEEMRLNMVNIDQPGKIADFIAAILNIDRQEQQKILEMLDVRERLEQVLVFIKKEQELMRIQKKIQTQINERIEKSQREYFLKEELKEIKKELGMPVDAKSSEYQKFKEQLEKLKLSGEVKEAVENELEKFALMDTQASEFIVTRNYLDTVFTLPWRPSAAEDIDVAKAKAILDEDHYGLDDVKERILEFLAVRKLRKNNKGSILCLVGPPGVGKTSIGKSVARALGKKFFRFSVGGMRDEAEIKGHRRTYIGAMPGKIIQGLKIVKTNAPVFMIDEIDKLGASYQGDPSSALLEVLDPEQNVAFRDHYLDLPFDISNILFIATANTLENIPLPLMDRMEVIRLSGYIDQEKIAIAKKYIIPRSLERAGLRKNQVKYGASALSGIAENWARESGMRSYEKALDRIHRKIARKIVADNASGPFAIERANLEEYLGQPTFRPDELIGVTGPGMAVGLAWTNFGGEVLLIEAVTNPGKEGFKITGQIGAVMQESASIAYTYVRHIAERFGITKEFFENNLIHMHIPAGAIPKDGPSAGITMATALLSLASNRIIKKNLAMTGELSLTGSVLPIGGLKEKTIAAKRNGVKTILFPKGNERDVAEIPDHVKKGLTFHPMANFDDVLGRIW